MPKPGSGGEEVAREESAAAVLAGLLPRAVASPRQVATSDGGAVLVVALHCLMARASPRDGTSFTGLPRPLPTPIVWRKATSTLPFPRRVALAVYSALLVTPDTGG